MDSTASGGLRTVRTSLSRSGYILSREFHELNVTKSLKLNHPTPTKTALARPVDVQDSATLYSASGPPEVHRQTELKSFELKRNSLPTIPSVEFNLVEFVH